MHGDLCLARMKTRRIYVYIRRLFSEPSSSFASDAPLSPPSRLGISILKRKKDSISREVSAPINHPFPQLLVRSALGRESSLARAARTGAPDRDDDAKMAVGESEAREGRGRRMRQR